jgi:shikimate kinase
MNPRVVLVGVPGSGKTTIGRQLARAMRVDFRDTDADVESSVGMSIPDIFVSLGEPAFRHLEAEAVAIALAEHDGVLSLGGGAILNSETRELLRDQTVVWLDIDLATAAQRVGMNKSRPLLLGNVRNTLKRLLEDRAPLYASVATHHVLSHDKDIHDVVTEIRGLIDA